MDFKSKTELKALRSFGLLVGGVFAAIGLWPWVFRHSDPRIWALVVSVALVVPALVWPAALRPVYRAWMTIGHALGWVNSRIVLGVAFFVVFTPTGLVLRLLGKDPMRRRFDPAAQTYRVKRTPRDANHMQKPF
jgi:O-antigen/teichoic acid export membrane protein